MCGLHPKTKNVYHIINYVINKSESKKKPWKKKRRQDEDDDARRDGARVLFRCVFVVVAQWELVFTADDDWERSTRRIGAE